LHLPITSPPDSYQPDSLWSYELGTKSRLLDNRLTLNLAVFHIDWKDIQQDIVLPASGFDFETNVGRATSDGLEFDARLRATDALTLTASGSYTRAVFAEDMPALGEASPGVLNVRKGDPIQGQPRFNASLGFEYRFRAMNLGDAFVRAMGSWTGKSHGSFVRSSSDYVRPGYFTATASAGLTLDRWEFSVFAKNLTNNHKIIQQPLIQSVPQAYYLRPRTIGLTASYQF
ncbi:MAG TPA: TonB-dependent receptor, partial [Albitalea sp.]|nr:TonB-dependent receptor [Albitalea sp.]